MSSRQEEAEALRSGGGGGGACVVRMPPASHSRQLLGLLPSVLHFRVVSGLPSGVSGSGFRKPFAWPSQTDWPFSGSKVVSTSLSSTSAWTEGTAAEAKAVASSW